MIAATSLPSASHPESPVQGERRRIIVEMISAVFESHRLGGQRVTFPLKPRQSPLSLL